MARLISEGKHWPTDYVKTGINMVKGSPIGKQSWYNDDFITKDMKTFADEFGPLSHKNSNLGFFSTIVRWFIEHSGTSKDKYQEFIERKLDGIVSTLQLVLNDPSYDKIKDEIKTKWPFAKFEELQKQIEDEKEKLSAKKMKSIKKTDDYELIPINSYEELNKKFGGRWTGYKGESKWCHANGKSTYDSWTKNGTQMFFVLAKKDWKEIKPPQPETTNAYDLYGLSLIAILVDVATGKLLNETLRWNHVIDPSNVNWGSTVDKAFKDNYGELSQAVGMDVKAEVEKKIKAKQDELKNKAKHANEEVDEILKSCGDTITDSTIPDELRMHINNVKIPSSISYIGVNSFYACKSLTSVSIPDSITRIDSYAFSNCESLTNIEIPNSVESIGTDAFHDCESLTSIQIPDSVKIIGNGAFEDCKSLTNIEIPNSVKSIGNYAFSGCKSLTSIQIPDSVKRIGYSAFEKCESLTSIQIPDSVESIGDGAFSHCVSLASIQIPNSVESIGDYAFSYCDSLTNIKIPDSVKSIGYNAFSYSESSKEVIFIGKTLDKVRSMDEYPWGIEDESVIKAEKSVNSLKESKEKQTVKTYKSKLGKTYTKKQICEAIQHWERLLKESKMVDELWQDFEVFYRKYATLYVKFEVDGTRCELLGIDKAKDLCVLVFKRSDDPASTVSGKNFLQQMLSSGFKASQVTYDKLYAEIDGKRYPFATYDTRYAGNTASFTFMFGTFEDDVEKFFAEEDKCEQ